MRPARRAATAVAADWCGADRGRGAGGISPGDAGAGQQEVYADAGAPDALRLSRHATGHLETAAMRAEVIGFLREWL